MVISPEKRKQAPLAMEALDLLLTAFPNAEIKCTNETEKGKKIFNKIVSSEKPYIFKREYFKKWMA